MASTNDLYDKQPPLIKAALDVAASGLPVFPTSDKMPVWSNADLGVGPGQGGYKVATTEYFGRCADPTSVRGIVIF